MRYLYDGVQVNSKSVQDQVCVGRVLQTTLMDSDRNREKKKKTIQEWQAFIILNAFTPTENILSSPYSYLLDLLSL